MSLHDFCRTCLFSGHNMYSIHCVVQLSKDLQPIKAVDLLNIVSRLNVSESNALPQQLCAKCYQTLHGIYAFILKCEESEMTLRQLAQGNVNINVTSTENTQLELPLHSAKSKRSRQKSCEIIENEDSVNSQNSDICLISESVSESSMPSGYFDAQATRGASPDFLPSADYDNKISVTIKEEPELELYADVDADSNDNGERPVSGGASSSLGNGRILEALLKQQIVVTPDVGTSYETEADYESAVAIKQEPELDLREDDSNNSFEINLDGNAFSDEPSTVAGSDERYESSYSDCNDLSNYVQCPICRGKFTSELLYYQHLVDCLPSSECDICFSVHLDRRSLVEHYQENHPGEIYGASNQKIAYPNAYNNVDDRPTKDSRKSFEKEVDALRQHVCPFCAKHFLKEASLLGHMKVHKRMFICRKCDKPFRSNNHRMAHEVRRHGSQYKNKTIECGVCDKMFACKADQVRHHLTHTKEKPYACNQCQQKYRYKKFLETHLVQAHDISEVEAQSYLKEKYGSTKLEMQLGPTYTCDLCDLEVNRLDLVSHVNGHMNRRKQS